MNFGIQLNRSVFVKTGSIDLLGVAAPNALMVVLNVQTAVFALTATVNTI